MLPDAFSIEILIFSYGFESFSQTFPQGLDKVTLKIIIFSNPFLSQNHKVKKSEKHNVQNDFQQKIAIQQL